MSRLLTSTPNPNDPAFWVAAGIALAATVFCVIVLLAVALFSRNKKRRKHARKLLRQMFGGGK